MKAYNLPAALQHPEQTRELYIHNRNLEEIPEAVYGLKNLKVLGLSNNKITHLSDRLKGLPFLEKIDLARNNLTYFPEVLLEIQTIKSLNLSNNKISTLPDSFKELEQLETLNISDNQLEIIPPGIFLSSLKKLDLSNNQISKIPSSIKNCNHLDELLLQKNKIKNLPKNLGHCSNLRIINLNENQIKVLPATFGLLKSLEKFTIAKNKLNTIPETIGACTWLRALDFHQNKIQKLPGSIGQLSWLFRLNLRKNQLKDLPATIGKLSKLRTLNLEYNQLQKLPASWTELLALQTLGLQGNQLEVSRKEILKFEKLKKLPGLKSVFTTQEKRQLLSFLNYCRQKKLSEKQRFTYYELMVSDGACTREELIIALSFPMKVIREKALSQLFKNYNPGKPLVKDSVVSFSGRSNLDKKKTGIQIENLGLTYQSRINQEVSHLVLGAFPNEEALLKFKEISFLQEQELQAYIATHTQEKAIPFSRKAVENLSQLLLSTQEKNTRLAIGILQNSKPPQELITDLFIAYKKTSSASCKKQLKTLLHLNASDSLQQKLSLRLPLKGHLPKDKLVKNINRYVAGTELEVEKILKHFRL